MIYLNKILPVVVLPIGIVLILILAGLLLRRRALIWIALILLWLGSTPTVGNFLMRATEQWAERRPAASAPTADAIVVLSGGRYTAPGPAAISEWDDPDRFFGGVELFKAGKAPLLVFTGGWAPWEPSAAPEGKVLIPYATALGIPAEQIVTTGPVTNTAEEAVAVAALLRMRQTTPLHILLVTSANHMPRARRLFERAGLEVTPFPVDFKVSQGAEGPGARVLGLLPRVKAFELTETSMREGYGRLFYWLISFWRSS